MARSPASDQDTVVLPRQTHELVLRALEEASRALKDTHRLRATNHIFLIVAVGLLISSGAIWLAPKPRGGGRPAPGGH